MTGSTGSGPRSPSIVVALEARRTGIEVQELAPTHLIMAALYIRSTACADA
jgi:hypothetical protein